MYYGKYKQIRNASWQCLIDCGINQLPVPIGKMCTDYGINIINNSSVGCLHGESGKLMMVGGKPLIIVDDSQNRRRIRFTIAHELSHYLLGHCGDDVIAINREYRHIKPAQESEADTFAARLLAPACVLWGLDIHSAEDIARLCDISIPAAAIRAERMAELYSRNMFLTHPLERKVYGMFEEYIKTKGVL